MRLLRSRLADDLIADLFRAVHSVLRRGLGAMTDVLTYGFSTVGCFIGDCLGAIGGLICGSLGPADGLVIDLLRARSSLFRPSGYAVARIFSCIFRVGFHSL